MATAALLAWMKLCALHHGVDPHFALAVAQVESGKPGQELRCGRLGRSRYFGPFGIEQNFLKRWPVDDPYMNCLVGVRALRGPNKIRVLRRYNTACNPAYIKAVMSRYRANVREGRP